MKILLCTPYAPKIKDNIGGIAVWAKNITDYYKEQKNDDVEIEVLPYNRTIYVHDGLNKLVRLYKGVADYLNLILQTRQRLKKERFDVLHLCSSALWGVIRDYIVMLMAKKYGATGVLHFHCGRIPSIATAKKMRWRILKKAVEAAGATIVLDDDSRNVLASSGCERIYKIPNPLSAAMTEKIAGLKSKTSRVPRRILFVGHVLPSKGVVELATACARLQGVEVRLLGRVEEDFKTELLKINSKLLFLGEHPHDTVLSEMLACDIFVFPSHTEGFPNVVLEAMACQTPIIASSVGAVPEMLNNGECGLLIPPRNADAVYDAVSNLLVDDARKEKYAENSHKRAGDLYSISSVWANLLSVWNESMCK